MGWPSRKEGVRLKLLVSLNTLELETYLKFTNSFIIGLENYSINYYNASIEEIEQMLKKYPDIDLFISMNKNIFNEDLPDLKEKLLELNRMNIKGIFFYDLSILNLIKELNLNIPLVISQDHLITNYNICNYYFNKGVTYANLSSDITVNEIIDIGEKTNGKLMTFFFGNILVTHSKRKLLTNFYDFYKLDKTLNNEIENPNNLNYNRKTEKTDLKLDLKEKNIENKKSGLINEKNKEEMYYIEENKIGTNILTKKILNAARYFFQLKNVLDYAILDSNVRNFEQNDFLNILRLYKLALDDKINETDFIKENEKIMKGELYEGFFNKKTIYKVK